MIGVDCILVSLESQPVRNTFSFLQMAGFAISLQELQDKFRLSQAQLDAELSNEDLAEVSSIIAGHEMLGPVLGLTSDDMDAISQQKAGLQNQRLTMLRIWKQKRAWKASYRMLIKALLKCNRADCAQKMCQLLAQSK